MTDVDRAKEIILRNLETPINLPENAAPALVAISQAHRKKSLEAFKGVGEDHEEWAKWEHTIGNIVMTGITAATRGLSQSEQLEAIKTKAQQAIGKHGPGIIPYLQQFGVPIE